MDAIFLYIVLAILLLIVIAFMCAILISVYQQNAAKSKMYLMTVTENGRIKIRRYRGSKNITIDRVEKW